MIKNIIIISYVLDLSDTALRLSPLRTFFF